MSDQSIMTTSTRDVSDFLGQLRDLGKLHKSKVLTTAEFEGLKRNIMTSINPFQQQQPPAHVGSSLDALSVASSLGAPSPFGARMGEGRGEGDRFKENLPVNHPMRKPWVQKLAMERGRAFKYEFITGTTTRADEEGSEGARTPGGALREYKRQVMRVSPDGGCSEYSRVSPPQQHHAGYQQQQIARASPPQQYHQLPPASKFSPPQDHAPSYVSPPLQRAHKSKNVQGYYKSTYYNSPSSYLSGPEFSRLPKMFNNKPIFTKPPPNGRKLLGSRSAPNSGRKNNKDVEVGPPYSSR
ncbi:hypothetical protein TrST_g5448 [Triparma strigata]|uniref:Uncharacterized protein n=1 Tax=Triparma strigata TaxID=1606541 RepID=A0A9W7E7V3_9STRA|nr:hypothetical protein TrST_g5448 [Triparma strigata]